MVTIPKDIVKEESIQEGELVEIEVSKIKKDFFGALKGVGSFTHEDELKGQLDEWWRMKFIIDSYAWIEYLEGSSEGKRVKEILNSKNEIYTLSLNIAEVVSKVKRAGKDENLAYKSIIFNSKILDINPKIAKEGGIIHAEIREKIKSFGLVDSFLLVFSRKLGAKIITGDRHFKGFKEAILIN